MYSQTERRTRQECAATSPYCLSPAVSSHRHREELDRNVQLQVLIDSALHSVLRERDQNQIGMCSYKSLLPQSCSQYSETGRRTRQECAATSPYCLSPEVSTHRWREELDRNVQLQVLIASVLQSYSQRQRRTRQECAATSPYCLSPEVSTQRQREELDRNVQLQVLIASALQSVLKDREKNQIGMCSYKSLLPQPCSNYSERERRTRYEFAATSTYCLSPDIGTHRDREELDRNVQLQVLIDSALQSVLRDREQNQILMCSYKSLLPQPCSWYSKTERRTRQECAATSTYCLSPDIGIHRHREELNRNGQLQVLIASVLQSVLKERVELDRNVQLQVLIASVLKSVLTDGEKNQIGMCSYKYLLPQS